MAEADTGGLVDPDAVVVGPAMGDGLQDPLDDPGGEAPFSENPGDPAHRSAAFAEVGDGLLEPVAKRDLRLPAKQAARFLDIGLALARIVGGQRLLDDLRLASRSSR